MITFEKEAFNIFAYQYQNNNVYRSYCDLINVSPTDVHELTEIPFLFTGEQNGNVRRLMAQIIVVLGSHGCLTGIHLR